ncbi:MAG: 1-acyl-sn-glycerol-3-phosphate acyltransferase [Thiotrichales bacterium]|nr:1-acyl-sn-glycerol-3-phosphate acyltransferase [Thiotrichales bacterium]NOX28170.1 1-acyl-sn-glycerol-3-phosphate acyltransferase [Gammaproteobacteria bacterium]
MILFRSTLYLIFSLITIVIFAVLGLLTIPFPFEVRYGFIKQWARINLWWLKISCGLHYQIVGKENIPDTNAIIFCKHQSMWETMVLQNIFPPQVWVMKKELLKVPFFGWGLAMLEPIAIDRGAGRKALKQLKEEGEKRMQNGRWIVIFPEGTRMPPGEKGAYQIGGAMLAQHHAGLVLPVAHNAGSYWPKKGFLKKPGLITVAIGKPIDCQGLSAREINARAEESIEAMMAEIYSTNPPN